MIVRKPRLAGAVCVLLAGVLFIPPLSAHPDLERQIADMTSRIESDPRNAELYLQRGELHRIHRDWKDAKSDFEHAGKLSPDLATVDYFLGKLHLDAGRPTKAKRSLDRFLLREPEHAKALVTRARALVALGEPLAAASDFDRAIAAYGPDGRPAPAFYLERAHALADAGRIDPAIQGLDDGLRQLAQPVTLQLYAIELEQLADRHDAALARLDQIASTAQRKESWLARRGEILEDAGSNEEARQAYAQALEAIDRLPDSRKATRAMLRLREQAEGAIERLESTP